MLLRLSFVVLIRLSDLNMKAFCRR